jgi:hypothetical protein
LRSGVPCLVKPLSASAAPAVFEHFHITAFSARPEQPARRVLAAADSMLRSAVRRFAHRGLGKVDVYRSER